MSDLELKITGTINERLTGKGSRLLNRIMREKVLPIAMQQIAEDIETKAKENAMGISIPPQKVPRQATHAIGDSNSEYNSTGILADSIKLLPSSIVKSGNKWNGSIAVLVEYASYPEFGTGIFGPLGQPIIAKGKAMVFPYKGKTIMTKMTLGQPPNPYLRSSIWYIKENFTETKRKIESKLK